MDSNYSIPIYNREDILKSLGRGVDENDKSYSLFMDAVINSHIQKAESPFSVVYRHIYG